MGRKSQFGLLLALIFAGSMWFYVQRVLIPYQVADASTHLRPRGNLSDLYPRWLGARELLLHHCDPYSPGITQEIQLGYYGRPLDPARLDDPKDQQAFAYPVYVVFLLAPVIKLPFPLVRAAFAWFVILLTCASVFFWLRSLRWRPSLITIVTILALTLGCYPAVQGIKLQQLSLVVGGLIALCAWLIVEDYLALAGILLGITTIKPQLLMLLSLWLLLWAVSDWRARKRFVFGFALTMIVLLLGAELVLPGWMLRFYHALIAYRQYAGGGSVVEVLTTPLIGTVLAALLVLSLALLCWRTRRAQARSDEFSFTTAAVLTVTIAVIPMTALYNQLLLLPAIYWLAQRRRLFLTRSLAGTSISAVCTMAILWPWLATLGLSLASLFLSPEAVQSHWAAPLYSSLAIPIAVTVMLIPSALVILRARMPENQI